MKNIFIFLILICVGFVSCDGRKSQSESLKESIEEFKDSVGPIEVIKYIPKDYAENITDTILSNGFRIKIKTYTDMENGIVDTISVKDSVTTKTIKRDFVSVVSVYKDEKEIFNIKIVKSLFSDTYKGHGEVLNEMTLSNVRVDQFIFANKDFAQIAIDYYREPNVFNKYPEAYFRHYGLIVRPDGTYFIQHTDH